MLKAGSSVVEQQSYKLQVDGSIPSRPILSVNENTWIIADTHFGHHNIIRYCDRPLNHNEIMLDNWHNLVKKNDTILHLGDVTVWYGSEFYWAKEVKKLPGIKYLILGNHDLQWTPPEWFAHCGFKVVRPFQQKHVYFSHEPSVKGSWSVNIHGHTHQHSPFKTYNTNIGVTMYNASIEGMDYKPVKLGKILQEINDFENK